MSNPNIVNVANIYGKTTASILSSSYTTQISNGASSGKIYKVNTIMAANTNTTNATITVDVYRNSTSFPIANAITVPNNSSLVIVGKDTSIYLEEGDSIRALSGTANVVTFLGSWEEIS